MGASMKMFCFGFPGQGFHCLKVPGAAKQQIIEHQGLIRVEKGGMSEHKMEEELRNLIDDKWQWRVKKVGEKEFLAIFPSKQLLDVFSKSAGFTMALYNTWATVCPSSRDPSSSSTLQTGWVHLFNVPDRARSVEAVTLIGELAGEVVTVDELSVIKEEPVRIKLQAREIDKVKGYAEIFIEGVGYEIRFAPEKLAKPQHTRPPPPPPK